MSDEFDDEFDDFFHDPTIFAQADQISLTQSAISSAAPPPAPNNSTKHALAVPARFGRSAATARSGTGGGYGRNAGGFGGTSNGAGGFANPHGNSIAGPSIAASHLAPRPVGGVRAPAPPIPYPNPKAQAQAPTVQCQGTASIFEDDEEDEFFYPDVAVSEDGRYKLIEPQGSESGESGGGIAAVGQNKQQMGHVNYNGNAVAGFRPPQNGVRPPHGGVGGLSTGGAGVNSAQQYQQQRQVQGQYRPQANTANGSISSLAPRKPISRSISMGPSQSASHPQSAAFNRPFAPAPPPQRGINPQPQNDLQPSQSRQMDPMPASQGSVSGSQGGTSAWKRTNSAGELARRAAMQRAMGLAVEEPELRNEASETDVDMDLGNGNPHPVKVSSQAASQNNHPLQEDDPAFLRSQLALLRAQLQKVESSKAEADSKIQTVQSSVWKYQGEAKIIRTKFEEKEKANEELKEAMRRKVEGMQVELMKLKAEHQREVESLNSVNAFKTHNLLASTSKTGRFPSTQRSVIRNGASTPSRFSHNQNPQATPSRSPGKKLNSNTAFNRSPSKLGLGVPGKSPGRLGLGTPKPKAVTGATGFEDDFRTPVRGSLGVKQKGKLPLKAVQTVMDVETAPANLGFSNLHNAFAVGGVRPVKKQKVKHDEGVSPGVNRERERTPTSSSPVKGGGGDVAAQMGFEGDFEMIGEAGDEGRNAGSTDLDRMEVKDMIDVDEGDLWSKVVHLILNHTFTSQSAPDILNAELDSESETFPNLTLHKIMRLNVKGATAEPEEIRAHMHVCRSILQLCGSDDAPDPLETIEALVMEIWNGCFLFASLHHTDTLLSLLDLLQLIFGLLPHDLVVELLHRFGSDSLVALLEMLYKSTMTPPTASAITAEKPVLPEREKERSRQSEIEAVMGFLSFLDAACCVSHQFRGREIVSFAARSAGLVSLLQPQIDIDIRLAVVDLLGTIAACPDVDGFRTLLSDPENGESDPTKIPLIAALSKLLLENRIGDDATLLLSTKNLIFLATLAQKDPAAAFLLGQNHHLVPTLIRLLEQTSNGIWGISAEEDTALDNAMILVPALTILHYLVFPPPNDDPDSPRGLDLVERLHASVSSKEFVGLHHIFITGLGRISYADADMLEGWTKGDVTSMRDLAQDLLDVVVEGPEGDAVYEVYVSNGVEAASVEEPIPDEDAENAAQPQEFEDQIMI